MPNLPTMALEINKDTWPIAVACLPPMFATIPFDKVDGHYLVINELGVSHWSNSKERALTVSNNWQKAWMFKKNYEVMDAGNPAETFVEVQKV